VLLRRNSRLQSASFRADFPDVAERSESERSARAGRRVAGDQHRGGAGVAIGLPHLAHELNSLLDGALRTLRMMERSVHGEPPPRTGATPSSRALEERIGALGESLQRISELLERAMQVDHVPVVLAATDLPMGEAVEEIVKSLAALAEDLGVIVDAHVAPGAASRPVGPLAEVIRNGLKNAIEASARSRSISGRHVRMSIEIEGSRLSIVIADSGAGVPAEMPDDAAPPPHGHGIGLAVCRRVVESLGGRMRLVSVPFGRGAIFHVEVPLRRLCAA
jgi:signal transduction histidine kinase